MAKISTVNEKIMNYFNDKQDQKIWNTFVADYKIDQKQQDKFKQYFDLIIQENQKYNITAITSVKGIILDHFYDSLSLIKLHDMSQVKSMVDVGSGGGFPGLPLAIMNSHATVHLVEVIGKKIQFLIMVKEQLGLDNVIIHQQDWRTFLRLQSETVDIVTARASLQFKELVRMFKPSSLYKNGQLVYWASEKWVPTSLESVYLSECLSYKVGQKKRNLCFFVNSELSKE